MARTTDKELESICERLNQDTGGAYDFSLGYAYGGVRLERKGGSVDVSPRLTKGELKTYMHAFLDGLTYATSAGYCAPKAVQA